MITSLMRRLPPEIAHDLAIEGLKGGFGPKQKGADPDILTVDLAGYTLSNPLGLAAGFDKNAEVPDAMLAAGFGFVECGTVTPRPQVGNPKPRVFRLKEDESVINRLGFNNEGLDRFVGRLKKRLGRPGLVGANLGANKDSQDRIADYVTGLKRVWGLVGYYTINISSPNTPGLRDLQEASALEELLGRLNDVRADLAGDDPAPPLFLKVAPDLDEEAIETISGVARQAPVDAIIVSNTTISRPSSLVSHHKSEAGGLSGRAVFDISTRALKLFRQAAGPRMQLIGVGGVSDGATAYTKIRAGASAVQLYTGLIYGGPGRVQTIKTELADLLEKDGIERVGDAVGADVKR